MDTNPATAIAAEICGHDILCTKLTVAEMKEFQAYLTTTLAAAPVPLPGAQPKSAWTRNLSAREKDILRLIMLGNPNKMIARELGITESTVKVHVKAILKVMGVKNRTQAALNGAAYL